MQNPSRVLLFFFFYLSQMNVITSTMALEFGWGWRRPWRWASDPADPAANIYILHFCFLHGARRWPNVSFTQNPNLRGCCKIPTIRLRINLNSLSILTPLSEGILDQGPTVKKPLRITSEAIDNDVSFNGPLFGPVCSTAKSGIKEKRDIIISGPSCYFSFWPMAQFSGFPERLDDVVLGPKSAVVLQKVILLSSSPGHQQYQTTPGSIIISHVIFGQQEVLGRKLWNHRTVHPSSWGKRQRFPLNQNPCSKSCVNRIVLDRIQFCCYLQVISEVLIFNCS